ncbi:hypothetical protein N1851_010331 [Merluccius polli]|uniref:DDE Tnp4 domain-containing protein n=1 Tax=Merluccius polli TaxID=89951 RepID=A0AA47P3E9_MERPO|nr:hypothetical protein N1851_010331 [Merluccius polli]
MTARRNVLETVEDCELIKRYRLNREGIKLVVELFIRFPLDNQQLHRIKANFMAIADEDVFLNRKKVHSINTQIAFDATFYILDVAKWPGSTHDPRILMGSGLRREWLSLQDVLTPYLSPQPGAQLKYNMQRYNRMGLVVRHCADQTHTHLVSLAEELQESVVFLTHPVFQTVHRLHQLMFLHACDCLMLLQLDGGLGERHLQVVVGSHIVVVEVHEALDGLLHSRHLEQRHLVVSEDRGGGVGLVQNAAARLLTRTRKYDHITPILSSLHWLTVKARSDVKVLLLIYKILHGLAPSYLKDRIIPYCPSRPLRSSGAGLSIPKEISRTQSRTELTVSRATSESRKSQREGLKTGPTDLLKVPTYDGGRTSTVVQSLVGGGFSRDVKIFYFLLQLFDDAFSLFLCGFQFLFDRLVEIIPLLFNASHQSSEDLLTVGYLSVCVCFAALYCVVDLLNLLFSLLDHLLNFRLHLPQLGRLHFIFLL